MVRAAADDDAGALLRQGADDLGLIVEQVVIAGEAGAFRRKDAASLIPAGKQGAQAVMLEFILKQGGIHAAFLRGQGDDLPVIIGNIQFLCQHFPHGLSAAAILTRDGDDHF